MLKKTILSLALLILCATISPAFGATIAGLSGWYADGDFKVYQAGGFVAFSKGRTTSSVEFLGGTVDYGGDDTTNRVDLNIATSMRLIQSPGMSLSLFAGYKMQSFETDIDFSGYGPSLGGTLSMGSLSASYAMVRTMGGEFDGELIQIPTISFRLSASSAPFGLMLGSRGEIFEDAAVHGGFVRGYMLAGR